MVSILQYYGVIRDHATSCSYVEDAELKSDTIVSVTRVQCNIMSLIIWLLNFRVLDEKEITTNNY